MIQKNPYNVCSLTCFDTRIYEVCLCMWEDLKAIFLKLNIISTVACVQLSKPLAAFGEDDGNDGGKLIELKRVCNLK